MNEIDNAMMSRGDSKKRADLQKRTADFLHQETGVPGLVYNAGTISGYRGPKARNYVMFPGTEDMIEIRRKYGLAGPAIMGPAIASSILSQYGDDPEAR